MLQLLIIIRGSKMKTKQSLINRNVAKKLVFAAVSAFCINAFADENTSVPVHPQAEMQVHPQAAAVGTVSNPEHVQPADQANGQNLANNQNIAGAQNIAGSPNQVNNPALAAQANNAAEAKAQVNPENNPLNQDPNNLQQVGL